MKETQWSRLIPWYLTICCSVSIILISFYLYQNIQWFKNSAWNSTTLSDDYYYRVYIYSTHLSMLKRSLGIITGVTIAFLGLGICFYSIDKNADIEINSIGKIASATPGMVAIFLGTFLISQSIASKDTFSYDPLPEVTDNSKPTK